MIQYTAEQSPMEQQARAAAEQIVVEIRNSYNRRFADIDRVTNEDERIRLRAQLAREAQRDLGTRVREQISRDTDATRQSDTPEQQQEKAQNAKRIFLETKYLSDQEVNVVNRRSQAIVDKIVERIRTGEITDQGALDIERNIGAQLVEGVVFSQPNEQASSFEEGLRTLLETNPQAANAIIGSIAANPETYGTTRENLFQKLGITPPESNLNSPPTGETVDMLTTADFGNDIQYYQSRFTDAQLTLISTFYSPEKFVTYMEQLSNPPSAQREKQERADKIRKYYEKINKPKNDAEIKIEVDRYWGERVSEELNWRVSDIVNQLFLELQQKSPNKFYEEIMQEDIFQGPAMIQKRIQAAINSLMTKVDQIERDKNSPLARRIKNLSIYRLSPLEGASYIEERGEGVDQNLYPRIKPFPYGEQVDLATFIKQMNQTIDQTIHKAEYFHNARAMYGHPAGEKGFYSQLGGYAESLKGNDIDEILLLPDGQYVMQAYQLYEKMLEEDFASLDWKHRPDQFSPKLERVNSKIEEEVFDQLKNFYPDLPVERVRNIVNSAIGIGRGVFLTEPEKSAYADPVDSQGEGMVASYSTNDAASLNVFNPLHNALRWQGEHNWNLMYFMPVEGQPGKKWDHKESWNNMAKYMDSFVAGKGRSEEKLPQLFADAMMDINNVGGPNKRKGWRMQYSLDSHFVYDKDNTINAPETFKAMEAIGYEAIANFIKTNQLGDDLLKATEKTAPANKVKERKEMFRYIFQRYFADDPSKFRESDLDSYMNKLRKKGKEQLLKKIQKNEPIPSKGSYNNSKRKFDSKMDSSFDEMVEYEASQLFMQNTLAHYVAERMPSKFLRIDRNRFNESGVSRWEKVWREFKEKDWKRDQFDKTMKNLTMAEMLLRRKMSEQIREQISLDKEWKLHQIDETLPYRLTEKEIREVLSKNKNGQEFKSEKEINDVVELWTHIKKDFINDEFLDGEGAKKISDYTFTFGLEDTDISLIPYRATGPRMIARAIKDTGSIEATVTPWIMNMPQIMNEMAVNGKHDFSPIIEYMRKAQKAIWDVHGSEGAQKYMYEIAGAVINYYKKDDMAKPLFGLFGSGKLNSIAAEYAGRGTAVWEWDSRDVDRFATALESFRLLPRNPYDLNKTKKGEFIGGQPEDRWVKIPFLNIPIKLGKQRHVDYKYNGDKLRREHGADFKAITWDSINQFLPFAMAILLWKHIKDSMDEASGKKKQ